MKYLSPSLVCFETGENVKLSKNFNSKEFEDPTSKYHLIDLELVEMLQKMRNRLKCSMKITSGYRSDHYQMVLRERGYETAERISTHQVGTAVDIWTGKHSGKELEAIAKEVGFCAIGVGNTFIHVDLRSDKIRSWTYKSRQS